MVDAIEIRKDIETPISCFLDIIEKLISVEELMSAINNQLKDNRWEGESKEKCMQIHEAVTIYCDEIKTLCDSVHKSIKQLKMDADGFHSISSNIALIQSI